MDTNSDKFTGMKTFFPAYSVLVDAFTWRRNFDSEIIIRPIVFVFVIIIIIIIIIVIIIASISLPFLGFEPRLLKWETGVWFRIPAMEVNYLHLLSCVIT